MSKVEEKNVDLMEAAEAAIEKVDGEVVAEEAIPVGGEATSKVVDGKAVEIAADGHQVPVTPTFRRKRGRPFYTPEQKVAAAEKKRARLEAKAQKIREKKEHEEMKAKAKAEREAAKKAAEANGESKGNVFSQLAEKIRKQKTPMEAGAAMSAAAAQDQPDVKLAQVDEKKRIIVDIRDIDDNRVEVYNGENRVCIIVDTKDGFRDPRLVRDYYERLLNKEITPEPYFTKKDGKIYRYLKAWFQGDLSDPENQANLHNLMRYINIRHRQLTDTCYFGTESINAALVRSSYEKDSTMIGGENVLKNMAWFAVHSYMTDIFASEAIIYDIIPKHYPASVAAWNSYVSQMTDVPAEVKKKFMLKEDGVCEFTVLFSQYEKCYDAEKIPDGPSDIVMTDTVPFHEMTEAEAIDSNERIKHFERMAAEERALNRAFTARVEEPENQETPAEVNPAMNVETTVKAPVEEKKEYTFGQISRNPDPTKSRTSVNPAEIASVQNMSMSSIMEQGVPEVDEPDTFDENNRAWEGMITGLEKFTKLAHKNGLSVIYNDASGYPGLILAQLVSKENGGLVNLVMIDPCILYGDTLRVMTLKNQNGDIRTELSVALSQEKIVEKMMWGTLKDEDAINLLSMMPKAFFDTSNGGYTILDRLDLRLIKGDEKGINFMTWRSILSKISTILQNIPLCRFAVMNVASKDKFELLCNENVLACFPTPIYNEPSHINEATHKLYIMYDANKYKDSHGYIVAHIDNSPLTFDPYANVAQVEEAK